MMQKISKGDKFVLSNIIWAIIAVLSNFLVSFFTTPYITENIGVDAYGFVTLATVLTTYIDIVAITLNAFASRYIAIYYHKRDFKQANIFFNSVIISNIFFAIALFLLCGSAIIFLEKIIDIPNVLLSDVKILFLLVIINYIITILGIAFGIAPFIKNRLDKSEFRKSVSYILKGIVIFVLCWYFYPHIWYVAIANICASLFLFISNIYLTLRLTPELKFNMKLYSFKAVKELISAGFWNSFNALGNVLNDGLDLLIATIMLSAKSMGELSVGKSLSTIFNLFLNAVCNAFKPKQLKYYAEGQIDLLTNELKTSMKYCSIITNLVFAGFISCGKYFLEFWIPSQDIDAIYYITCISLWGNLIVGVVSPLYYVYTLTKRLKFPSLITVGMGIANVLLMYILLQFTNWGIYSIVLTTAALNYAVHIFDAPIYSAICLNIKKITFYPVIIRHFISSLITTAALVLFVRIYPIVNNWIELIILGILCALIGITICIMLTFNKNEIKTYMTWRIKR